MKHTCTFTGHRPEHLELPEEQVIQWLEEQIKRAADEGYTDFITGMQRGVDLLAAEAVLKLIDKDRQIRLIAACAFRGMEEDWKQIGRNGIIMSSHALNWCIISAITRTRDHSLTVVIGWLTVHPA